MVRTFHLFDNFLRNFPVKTICRQNYRFFYLGNKSRITLLFFTLTNRTWCYGWLFNSLLSGWILQFVFNLATTERHLTLKTKQHSRVVTCTDQGGLGDLNIFPFLFIYLFVLFAKLIYCHRPIRLFKFFLSNSRFSSQSCASVFNRGSIAH